MTVPTSISGSIIPRTNTSAASLPKLGFSGPNISFPLVSSANESEIFTKTPSYLKSSGSTLDGLGAIYLNSSNFSTSNRTTTFGFMPDFYISAPSEINIGWVFATGYVNFANVVPSKSGLIDQNDKFEVIYIDYSTTSFLTAAGGGAVADAISGLTFGKIIINGNQGFTAKQMYYRYLGDLSA